MIPERKSEPHKWVTHVPDVGGIESRRSGGGQFGPESGHKPAVDAEKPNVGRSAEMLGFVSIMPQFSSHDAARFLGDSLAG